MFGILIGLLAATNLLSFSPSEEDIALAFAETGYTPQHQFVEFPEGKLHYVSVGDPEKPTILMIHGSPGSWDAYIQLITETDLLKNYHIISVDRPGYNATSIPGKFSMKEQSNFLKPILEKYGNGSCIVLGHSYGGGLAMQVGIDHQEHIKGLLLVAGTVAAPYQKRKWYNYAIKYTPAQWIIKDDFVVSNREMWALKTDLPAMEKELAEFEKAVVIIQGSADVLVDARSAKYLESKLTAADVETILIEDMNHFVIWSDMDLVLKGLKIIEGTE